MKIILFCHPADTVKKTHYAIKFFFNDWKDAGHKIVILKGPQKNMKKADVIIQHVDLTKVPEHYIDYLSQYPVVINGAVIDISKTSFSNNLLSRESNYTGQVIVKTNNNCGGSREKNIALKQGKHVPEPTDGWDKTFWIRAGKYLICDSIADVPEGVWKNPSLIVEKCLSEKDKNGYYCLHQWIFFGEREIGIWTASEQQVIKGGDYKLKCYFNDIPEELRKIRRQFKMDLVNLIMPL